MVIWNLIIVNNNHLVFKKEKPVGPTNFIHKSVFSTKLKYFALSRTYAWPAAAEGGFLGYARSPHPSRCFY